MAYDDWKLATPPEYEQDDPEFCYECQRDVGDCECDLDDPDDDHEKGRVLGKECLAVDPFHTSAECFDVEMAKAFMAPDASTPGPNGCVCGNNGDCNCPFAGSQ